MNEDVGKIGWIDMTVPNAGVVRDFYETVVGLKAEDVSMGDYSDYNMTMPASGTPVCGVCHSRGSNADLPPGWLVYFIVADIEESAAACEANGGKVLMPPRGLAGGRFCVIEDPGGATAALYQP